MGGERDSIVGLETKGIHRAGKGRSTLLPIYSFEGPCYRGKGKKEGLLQSALPWASAIHS
jgi:hypothetical protein